MHRPLGRQESKDLITVLVCANSIGTETFEPMFIGNSLRPIVFRRRSKAEHGLDYYANRNAWTTSALFHDWLKRFDSIIVRSAKHFSFWTFAVLIVLVKLYQSCSMFICTFYRQIQRQRFNHVTRESLLRSKFATVAIK